MQDLFKQVQLLFFFDEFNFEIYQNEEELYGLYVSQLF